MKKYDAAAIRTGVYRKRILERELSGIRSAVLGRDRSFLSVIADKDGRIKKERLETFINDMTGGYERYLHDEENGTLLTGDQKKLYLSFLYCAATGPSIHSYIAPLSGNLFYRIPESFQDILDAAGSLKTTQKSLEEMEAYEEDTESLRDDTLWNYFYIACKEKDTQVSRDHTGLDAYIREQVTDDRERRRLEEVQDTTDSLYDWQCASKEADRLYEEYNAFRKSFFQVDYDVFLRSIETMIDIYLYEHELGPMSLDSRFGLVAGSLRRASSDIAVAVERAVHMQ